MVFFLFSFSFTSNFLFFFFFPCPFGNAVFFFHFDLIVMDKQKKQYPYIVAFIWTLVSQQRDLDEILCSICYYIVDNKCPISTLCFRANVYHSATDPAYIAGTEGMHLERVSSLKHLTQIH